VTSKSNEIALFGTSADPPTVGHKALLKGLSSLFPKVITWASDNPIKAHSLSLEIRFKLLKILVKEIDNPHIELNQNISSPWTIETLKKANRLWPSSRLTFVIGSDLIKEIPHWEQAKDVLNKAQIAIAPRAGWPIHQEDLDELKSLGGRLKLLSLEIPNTSSTTSRNNPNIKNIPHSIFTFLTNQNLYNIKNKTK